MEHATESARRIGRAPSKGALAGARAESFEAPLHPMLQLQRQVGNQAVLAMLRSGALQAKVSVGAVDDPLEHEADRVADQVMRMPDPGNSVGTAPPQISRKCAACAEEDKEKMGRMKPADAAGPAGGEAPSIVRDVLGSSGQPLDAEARAFFEPRFGRDFSLVRIHTDGSAARSASSLAARAYTVREDIAFAEGEYAPNTPSGLRLLGHELAHVVQQGRSGVQPSIARQLSEKPSFPAPAPAGPVFIPSPAAPPNPFEDPKAWSNSVEAAKALDAYQKLSENERRVAVSGSYKKNLARVLRTLSPTDQAKYIDALREIGRFVEEMATRQTAKKSDVQIAAEEATFLATLPKDTVQGKAVAPPPAVSWWGSLSPAEQASWTTRGNAAISAVVSHASSMHPELRITSANFKLDFPGTEARGANVLAAGSPAMVGRAFVTTAELNPAYVMDVVVHEIFGHPEYGIYGTEYHLKLYDAAAKKVPGYTQPAAGSAERRAEIDAYAYHETEIYAVLRGSAFRTAPTASDAPKAPKLDPQALVSWHVGLMKQQWPSSLIVAILRGLRQRLVIDPRISGAALAIFDTALDKNLDAASAAEVKK